MGDILTLLAGGFATAATPINLLWAFIGCALGTAIGVLPGIGPAVLPWVVAAALMLCGALLIWHARSGGFRDLEHGSGAARGDWRALGWVSAGILANAALLTTIGFVLSCALCFTLAVRGLRMSEGRPAGSVRQTTVDAVTGMLIAAPAFWLFTKLLAINLPGLTGTGWL